MEQKKNVLLITYYWPPGGGAGVHRWLRFSNYFEENNVNLTVYCPEDAAWPIIDDELNQKVPNNITVVRRKIFEPHKYLGRGGNMGTGFTQQKEPGFFKKFIIWVRGNMFIPDSRVFWIKPSTRFLTNYLKQHPEIDTVISTGPPHSTHIIASNLKKKHGIKWVADFRDPWTQIDFYQELSTGERADAKHKRLEKMCIQEADEVVSVSKACAEGLEEIGNRPVHVITNGYDFPKFDPKSIELDKKFTISHFGSMPFGRNPQALWVSLSELIEEEPKLKEHLEVRLVGTVDYLVLQAAEKLGLKEYITLPPSVSHSESIEQQRKTQLLLLSANNTGNVAGILTGKFFEYLGAKRPILTIGQAKSDLHRAMDDTDAGAFADFDDPASLKPFIAQCFSDYLTGNLYHEAKNTEQFESRTLAKNFIQYL